MSDLNRIEIIGRLTRDPDAIRYTQGGAAILNISIAVNDGYGEKKYTSFFDVVIFGKTAENVKPYLLKGKQVAIVGKLRQERWEKDGAKNSRVSITCEEIQLLGGDGQQRQQPAPQQQAPAQEYDGGEFPEDIPF